MGIAYRCDKKNGITFEVWDGKITFEEWMENVQKHLDDPDWPAGRVFLSDLRSVKANPSIGEKEIQKIAAVYGAHPRLPKNARLAIIAAETFEKSQLFGRLLAEYGVTRVVFNSLDTACVWLGIEEKTAEKEIESLRACLRSSSGAKGCPVVV